MNGNTATGASDNPASISAALTGGRYLNSTLAKRAIAPVPPRLPIVTQKLSRVSSSAVVIVESQPPSAPVNRLEKTQPAHSSHSTSTSRSRFSSPTSRQAVPSSAVTTAYQRRLNFTSSTGLNRNAQNPGETITAVIVAMVVSGTWRALRISGIAIRMMPAYIPNTELVRPISQSGADRLCLMSRTPGIAGCHFAEMICR